MKYRLKFYNTWKSYRKDIIHLLALVNMNNLKGIVIFNFMIVLEKEIEEEPLEEVLTDD